MGEVKLGGKSALSEKKNETKIKTNKKHTQKSYLRQILNSYGYNT